MTSSIKRSMDSVIKESIDSVIKIDIVSDVSCPWCAVGYNELKKAIAQFDGEVDIAWLPFEINPDMSKEGQDVASYLSQKYGMTSEQQQQNMAMIESRGHAAGFEFKPMKDRHVYNSFDCHCLLHIAKEYDLQTPLKLALLSLYFQRGGDISDREMLSNTARDAGLPSDAIARAFYDKQLRDEVRDVMQQIRAAGVTSVPTLIVNNQYAIAGAQGEAGYLDILQQVAAMEN